MPLDEYGLPSEYTDLTAGVDWFNSPDFVLQSLAESSNRYGNGFAVTLIIAGGRISGVLTDSRSQLRGTAARIREMAEEDGSEDAIKFSEDLAKNTFDAAADHHQKELDEEFEMIKAGGEPERDVVARTLTTRYAYLMDAWYMPSGGPAVELGYTRVLLGHITAWVPGRV